MKYTTLTASVMLAGTTQAWNPFTALNLGFCPWNIFNMPKAVGNFDPERYKGTWYEIYRDKDLWYEQPDVQCVTATYSIDKNWWFYPIGVNNRSMSKSKGTLTDTIIDGTDIPYARASFDKDGYGKVKFWWYPDGNYWVLDTDYDNYALVYGCDNWLGVYSQEAWILSRTKTLTDLQVAQIKATL